MIIKLRVKLGIGLANAYQEDTLSVEVKDNATAEEIAEACEKEAQEWANDFIEISFNTHPDEQR